jgi:hypothetical protein
MLLLLLSWGEGKPFACGINWYRWWKGSPKAVAVTQWFGLVVEEPAQPSKNQRIKE